MARIAIVTDAWHPQINGVVTTLSQTVSHLARVGHTVKVIHPKLFGSVPCPTYPEIRLALTSPAHLRNQLLGFAPHAVHIATEGPLGWLARGVCRRKNFPFTTSYHTRFPEYIRMRMPVPLGLCYRVVRMFHRPAARTMVATPALAKELAGRGFTNLAPWTRGVDTELFTPLPGKTQRRNEPRMVYVGRVAVEKNISQFLRLDLPGRKLVIGDGPARATLEKEYPEATFVGYRTGEDLARMIAGADVMVFPSLTDTFGVVMLEAMACGVPVAAYPVTGPINVVQNGVNGWLDTDLRQAVINALNVPPESCRLAALKYSWATSIGQFHRNLALCDSPLTEDKREYCQVPDTLEMI